MADLKVVIAAAGRGTRAGLPYPKTLHKVGGKPILHRILELVRPYDPNPVIVVSPQGKSEIETSLREAGRTAELVIQAYPAGMGDAVLCAGEATSVKKSANVLLIWGDIPLIASATVAAVVDTHLAKTNDFTFATRVVEKAYTIVARDETGKVVSLRETREEGLEPTTGERDIGLFLFRTDMVMDALREASPGSVSKRTGEHGFLYLVELLARRGCRVVALPVATETDLISLNALSDLAVLPEFASEANN